MATFGVFNDTGCVDYGYLTLEAAQSIAQQFQRDGDEFAYGAEICPDHDEQPRNGCEECGVDGDES